MLASTSPIQWEVIACPLCDGRDCSLLITIPAADHAPPGGCWTIVRCDRCSMAFLNPRPDEARIGAFYCEDYPPHQVAKLPASRKIGLRRAPRPDWLDRWLAALLPPDIRRGPRWHGQGRLLDVGCGGGEFLVRMAARGWQVTGLDASERVVARIRSELKLPAWQGSLSHPELRPESFDVVTMWQSLEHMHRPLEALRHVRDVLVPDGRLIVSVPNIAGVGLRWFGPDWLGLDPPRHLLHFTPVTLRRMLELAGFRVERPGYLRRAGWLQESALRAVGHGRATSWTRLLAWRPAARWAAWYSCRTRQSDCLVVEAARADGA